MPEYFDATKYYEQADGDGLHHRDIPPTSRRCPECNKLNLKYNGGAAGTKVKDERTPRPLNSSNEVIVISDSPPKQQTLPMRRQRGPPPPAQVVAGRAAIERELAN